MKRKEKQALEQQAKINWRGRLILEGLEFYSKSTCDHSFVKCNPQQQWYLTINRVLYQCAIDCGLYVGLDLTELGITP